MNMASEQGEVSDGIMSLGLLWAGLGVTAVLSALDVNIFVAQGAGFLFFLFWVAHHIDGKSVTVSVMVSFAAVFFKEIGSHGAWHIPKTGGVLFAIGPHNNQFLDPVITFACMPQRPDIGYICAAVTLRRKFVGRIAKMMSCIPVERQQDIAKAGQGTVVVDGTTLKGEGTEFAKKIKVGDTLFVKGAGQSDVKVIENDCTIVVKAEFEKAPKGPVTYKVAPKVDQETFFGDVWNRLQAGQAIGLFPEGGSHDQSHFIGIKPGIALMALGAASCHGVQVPVVPIGLNYFKGHRFRSRVFVEFGEPIHVCSPQLIEQYRQGGLARREAVEEVMEKIRKGLCSVTVQAPDYHTLQLFWQLRRLYTPSNQRLSNEEKQYLVRGFAEGYEKFKDHAKVKDMIILVRRYMDMMKELGLQDYQVQKMSIREDDVQKFVIQILLYRCLLLAMWFVCWIPAGIVAVPFTIVSRAIAHRKAKEAKKNSSVKIAGRDVLATWKVLVGMGFVPALHVAYTLIAHFFISHPVAVAYFFFMPFVSLTGIRAQENIFRLARSLRPLILSLSKPGVMTEINELRKRCAADTTAVVEELGWGHKVDFGPSVVGSKRGSLTRSSSFGLDLFQLNR